MQYLSPFRSTFQVCQLLEGPNDLGAFRFGSKSEFIDDYGALEQLDLRWSWWMKLYRICESDRPIPRFSPSMASMKSLPLEPEHGYQFWPPFRAGGKRKGASAGDGDEDVSSSDQSEDETKKTSMLFWKISDC